MFSFIYFVLASLVYGSAANFFDCTDSAYNTESACVATKWCVWSTAQVTPSCIPDPCLAYVASIEDDTASATPCASQTSCKLFYITDIHDCATGEITTQTDIFCRSNNDLLKKQPIDACFYQDLKNRYTTTPPVPLCTNLEGGIACTSVGSGNKQYCDSTGQQTCNNYLEDNDLPGFCGCLGPTYCNLYPGCATSKASGGPCVADPCADATISAGACAGNIVGLGNCTVVNVQQVSGNVLTNMAYCVTGTDDSNAVKKNEYNPCFYGISQTVTYPTWNVNKTSDCQTVSEQNQCAGIVSSECESVDIAAGWFSAAQGHYCTDNKNRNVPSPSASSVLRLPSILFLLVVAIVAVL